LTNFSLRPQNGLQPVKRRRALLASNPLRNSRWEADANDAGAAMGRPCSRGWGTASPCLKNAPCPLGQVAGCGPRRRLPFCTYSLIGLFQVIVVPPLGRARRGGSAVASRRLPGMKHGPWALDSCSLGASFPGRLGPSHLYGLSRLPWSRCGCSGACPYQSAVLVDLAPARVSGSSAPTLRPQRSSR
jgi:hypothetical protein